MTTRHELSAVDFFLDRIAVASPQWENGLTYDREANETVISGLYRRYKTKISLSSATLAYYHDNREKVNSLSSCVVWGGGSCHVYPENDSVKQ
jgi:hypothetical protein